MDLSSTQDGEERSDPASKSGFAQGGQPTANSLVGNSLVGNSLVGNVASEGTASGVETPSPESSEIARLWAARSKSGPLARPESTPVKQLKRAALAQPDEYTEVFRRDRLGFVLLLVPAVWMLVDAAFSSWKGWRPTAAIESVVLGALGLYCVAVTLLLCFRFGQRMLAGLGVPLGVLLIVASGGLFAGQEVFAAEPSADAHLRRPQLKQVRYPSPELITGVQGPVTYSTNTYGVRGTAIPRSSEALRVLCVGGSTTDCVYLDDTGTWQSHLERELEALGGNRPIWIGSAGFGDVRNTNHLEFVSGAEVLGRVQAVVFLVGMNDFLWALRGDSTEASRQPAWSRSLALAGLVPRERHRQQSRNGEHLRFRRDRRKRAVIQDELPDLTEDLDRFGEQVAQLIELSRERGVLPIFVTQPALWWEGLDERASRRLGLGELGDAKYLSPRALREGLDLYNQRLLAETERAGVTCVESEDMVGLDEFYYDDCHFNERGAEAMGGLLARSLAAELLPRKFGQ